MFNQHEPYQLAGGAVTIGTTLIPPPPVVVGGVPRSPRWERVRDEHLAKEPECRACGRAHTLQVHHRKPFHLHPELELDPDNLMTLCALCHLCLGHCGDWRLFNAQVDMDVANHRSSVKVAMATGG